MKIIFFGSSNFAVLSLKALKACGHDVSCVITQADKKKGRGMRLEPTPVKSAALESGLKIYQPDDVNEPEIADILKQLHPDLFVVIAYGQFLSQTLLEIPAAFSINLHASLLPGYRGAAPINWALINGEEYSGVSVIKMTQQMDAGPIILQEAVKIKPDENFLELRERLAEIGSRLVLESVGMIENNKFKLVDQEKSKVSFAPKIKKEHGLIDWKLNKLRIYDLFRGTTGWPGAYTYYNGSLLKISGIKPLDNPGSSLDHKPGEIIDITKEGIVVACSGGSLVIEELQLAGKKIMRAKDFISGHKIKFGDTLGL